MRFRENLARFMAGRNGYDAFSMFLLLAAFVMLLLGRIFYRSPFFSILFNLASWVALLYCIWRVFSRNTYKRQRENAWYYAKRQAVARWFRSLKDRWQQRKEYKFFRCPSCHALLRVPRGKGKIQLTCRKCGNRFERKS